MKLSGKEFNLLIRAIAADFDAASLAQCLRIHLSTRLDQIVQGGGFNAQILEVLNWAENAKRTDDFLAGLIAANPTGPTIVPAITEIRNARKTAVVPAGGGATDAIFLRQRHLVNRRLLRDNLQTIIDSAPSYRVVIVAGPSGSGRSHSRFLIQFVADQIDGIRCVLIDALDFTLNPNPGSDQKDSLRRMLVAIASALGLAKESQGETFQQSARDVRQFIYWLAGALGDPLIANRADWWLILDNFDDPSVPEDLAMAAQILAEEAENRFDRLWIFLLGFSRTLKPDVDAFVLRETVEWPVEHEVRSHLMLLAQQAQKIPLPAVYDQAIGDLRLALGNPPFIKDRMHAWHMALVRAAQAILK
jgi:hypothetical protein